jgi:hypothetical protein
MELKDDPNLKLVRQPTRLNRNLATPKLFNEAIERGDWKELLADDRLRDGDSGSEFEVSM